MIFRLKVGDKVLHRNGSKSTATGNSDSHYPFLCEVDGVLQAFTERGELKAGQISNLDIVDVIPDFEPWDPEDLHPMQVVRHRNGCMSQILATTGHPIMPIQTIDGNKDLRTFTLGGRVLTWREDSWDIVGKEVL